MQVSWKFNNSSLPTLPRSDHAVLCLSSPEYDTRTENQVKQDFWRLAQERLQSAERLAAQADGNKDRSIRRLPILIGRSE